jgi:death-on-curing protein
MQQDPTFLTLAQIEALHDRALQCYGGSPGTRDAALLESATNQPQNDYFYGNADLCGVAAAYCFHLAEAQAYLDGNKRTAVAAALTFLAANRVSIGFDSSALYDAMIALAEKEIGKPELAELLRKLTRS